MIWKRKITLEALNAMGEGNMVGFLDIRFEHIGDDTLEATMPVDSRTKQPFGLLHGGASVVLAESIGSVAGYLCTKNKKKVEEFKNYKAIYISRCYHELKKKKI